MSIPGVPFSMSVSLLPDVFYYKVYLKYTREVYQTFFDD